MALKHVNELLKEADAKKKAVVAIDVFNYDSMNCAVSAAEKVGSPIIVMFFPGDIPASTFSAIAADMARHASVDVSYILDHGPSYEAAMECVAAGFPSVMIDCSALPFEENIQKTREVVKTAHLFGVDVEAELGHVGEACNEADYKDTSRFAKPDEVVEFVERTGVDSLAVHFGSAHGIYKSTPHLDLELLDKINHAVDLPLVLHGGSGIPFEQVKQAIKLGINKVNFGTEYDHNFARAYREILEEKAPDALMFEMTPRLLEKTYDYTASLLHMAWDN